MCFLVLELFTCTEFFGTSKVTIWKRGYPLRRQNAEIELLIFVKKQPFFSVKYFFKNDEQPKKTVGEMCVYGEAYINKRGQIKFKKMY